MDISSTKIIQVYQELDELFAGEETLTGSFGDAEFYWRLAEPNHGRLVVAMMATDSDLVSAWYACNIAEWMKCTPFFLFHELCRLKAKPMNMNEFIDLTMVFMLADIPASDTLRIDPFIFKNITQKMEHQIVEAARSELKSLDDCCEAAHPDPGNCESEGSASSWM